MAVELYIEDELIDLIGDEKIQTDYAIAEIGNFSTRQGFRGINFDIPKTANNKKILENSDLVNNTTTRPYRRLKARVYVDGIDQNIRFADIESIQDNYNIRLYGGNASFFEDAKNLSLIDLELSEYDHYINLTNVVNSRTNTDGYIYPLIDYHIDSPNVRIDNISDTYRVNYTFPSVFLETIIDRIVNQLGYTINNTLLNDVNYQKAELVLPCVTPVRNFDFNKYKQIFYADLTPPFDDVPVNLFANSPAALFEIITPQSQFYQVGAQSPFEFADEVEYTATYRIEINNSGIASTIEFLTFDTVSTNPNQQFISIFSATVNAGANVFTGTFTRKIESQPSTGVTASQIFVNNTNASLKYTLFELEIVNGKVLKPNPIIFGSLYKNDYVTVSSLFGKLKASDILRGYLQLFSSIIIVNEDNKEVNIYKFDEIKNNIGLALDWSSKLDYTDNEQLEFELDKYAQENILEYKDEQDVIKPTGTDGNIIIDDETLETTETLFTLPFAATNMVFRLLDLMLPNIGLFTTNDNSPPVTEQKEKTEPRILYLERDSGNVDYTDGTTTTTVTTNLPFAWFIRSDKEVNLGFANNLIPLYYGGLQSVLSRTKIVTENIRLNALDIQALDFLKPIYLDKHNAYFYISKISGFDYGSSESTEVELVKIR